MTLRSVPLVHADRHGLPAQPQEVRASRDKRCGGTLALSVRITQTIPLAVGRRFASLPRIGEGGRTTRTVETGIEHLAIGAEGGCFGHLDRGRLGFVGFRGAALEFTAPCDEYPLIGTAEPGFIRWPFADRIPARKTVGDPLSGKTDGLTQDLGERVILRASRRNKNAGREEDEQER